MFQHNRPAISDSLLRYVLRQSIFSKPANQ